MRSYLTEGFLPKRASKAMSRYSHMAIHQDGLEFSVRLVVHYSITQLLGYLGYICNITWSRHQIKIYLQISLCNYIYTCWETKRLLLRSSGLLCTTLDWLPRYKITWQQLQNSQRRRINTHIKRSLDVGQISMKLVGILPDKQVQWISYGVLPAS